MSYSANCRGSMTLGSGCGRCERCKEELSRINAAHPDARMEIAKRTREWETLLAMRRERIATEQLAALIGKFAVDRGAINPGIVKCAVWYADALIAELDRKGEEG